MSEVLSRQMACAKNKQSQCRVGKKRHVGHESITYETCARVWHRVVFVSFL
jgi:hypothetical protein